MTARRVATRDGHAAETLSAGHTAPQTLILTDFPPPAIARALSPNGRTHWAPKAKARKSVETWVTVSAERSRLQPIRVPVRATFRFVRPTRQRIDLDNLSTGVTKAALDALVRGGWLVDDDSTHVVSVTAEVAYEKGQRRLEIRLEPAA